MYYVVETLLCGNKIDLFNSKVDIIERLSEKSAVAMAAVNVV